MSNDNTIYVNTDGAYVPIGQIAPSDAIYDGLWIIKSHNHGSSQTNLIRHLGALPNSKNLNILAKFVLLEDIIVSVLNKCWSGNKPCSLADAAREISLELTKKEKKLIKKKASRKLTIGSFK